jgi:hypothetical protein
MAGKTQMEAGGEDLEGILSEFSSPQEGITKEDIASAHSLWLEEGSAEYKIPGSERPLRYKISPELEKLRGASFNSGRKLLEKLGFLEVESGYGRKYMAEPCEGTSGKRMIVEYHMPKMHGPHWHMYIICGKTIADISPEGKIVGWRDDPNYMGLGKKDLNSVYYQRMRHIIGG